MAKKAKADAVPEPWERMPGETSKAFEAFAIYRNLGPERSQEKVCKNLAKTRQHIGEWSRRYDWVNRAAAWDSEQDRINQIAQQKRVMEMNERHARMAMSIQGKMLEALKGMDLKGLKPGDISRLVEIGLKYERIARGAISPIEQHHMEYDARKQEIELMKIQAGLPPTTDESSSSESNFADALKGVASEVWGDEDNS